MKCKKIISNITQGLLLTMLMVNSSISSAQPQAIKDGEFLIGFENIEILGTVYSVRFRHNDFPTVGVIGDSSNPEKHADIANEILLDLIKKHGLPVGTQQGEEYCKPGKTCSIYTAYEIDSERFVNNVWTSLIRFKIDSNYTLLKSTIRKTHTALRDDDVLLDNQIYADWTKPDESEDKLRK